MSTQSSPCRRWLLVLWVLPLGVAGLGLADPYFLPDAELMSSQFGKLAGYSGSTSTFSGRTDVAGPGVVYTMTLSGGDSGKIGLGESAWPLDPVAGLYDDPGVPGGCKPHANSSLYGYAAYEMLVTYLDGPTGSDINIGLILNTGLTGPSGYPSNDSTNDTFWAGQWTTLALGQTAKLTLDFGFAQAWNISDNKAPHTGGGLGWADGGWYAINDRDLHEISNLGFQVADFNGDALGSALQIQLNAVPEPVSLAFMGTIFAGVVGWRWRRRRSGRG